MEQKFPIKDAAVTAEILNCFRVLELKPDASGEEVKRAYHELAKVWRPDRFPNDA